MPPPSLREAFSIGRDILATVVSKAKSTILAQTGDAVSGEVEDDEVEWYQQPGFWSRPAKATPGKPACQGVIIRTGGRDACVAARDPRNNKQYGNLDDGETCVGASTGPARTIYKKDGAIAMVTETESGQTLMLRLSPTRGLELVTPWGTFTFGPQFFALRHSSGVQLRGYGIGGLPPPLSSLGSRFELQAGSIKLNGMCLLGPYVAGLTTYMPAVWSPDPPGAPALIKGVNSLGVKLSFP